MTTWLPSCFCSYGKLCKWKSRRKFLLLMKILKVHKNKSYDCFDSSVRYFCSPAVFQSHFWEAQIVVYAAKTLKRFGESTRPATRDTRGQRIPDAKNHPSLADSRHLGKSASWGLERSTDRSHMWTCGKPPQGCVWNTKAGIWDG